MKIVKFDSGYLKKSGEIISLEEIIKLNKQGKLDKHDIFCPDCKIARLKLVHKKNIFLQTSSKQTHKQYCSKITDDTKSTSIKEPKDTDSERKDYIKNKLKNLLENLRLNQVNIDSESNEDKNLKDNDYFQNSKEVKHRNDTIPDESHHYFTNYRKKIIPKQSQDAFYFGICLRISILFSTFFIRFSVNSIVFNNYKIIFYTPLYSFFIPSPHPICCSMQTVLSFQIFFITTSWIKSFSINCYRVIHVF
ncbi:hypothetical protein A0X14_05325 [Campylobacter coli]|nr:hypothetical protein [Campylobacter coli]HEB9332892.1 hypothetical protein [Campylobacter coli]HED6758318.1 hypothetical protein [Campylobacter coli]